MFREYALVFTFILTLQAFSAHSNPSTTPSLLRFLSNDGGADEDDNGQKKKMAGFSSGAHNVDTLSWAVRLCFKEQDGLLNVEEKDLLADFVAMAIGLVNEGQIGELNGWYLFVHKTHNDTMHILKHILTQLSSMDHASDIQTAIKMVAGDKHKKQMASTFHSLLAFLTHQNITLSTASDWVLERILKVMHSPSDWTQVVTNITVQLEEHISVKSYMQQVVRTRQKRRVKDTLIHKRNVVFHDPAFVRQWHLVNRKNPKNDVNVSDVWARNITGEGVTVAIVDDGLEWENLDLKDNYCAEGSWDLNDQDPNPTPEGLKDKNHHGTRCAGEVAAAANTFCGIGVAYKSRVSGIRVLDGPMTDTLEASAFNMRLDTNDIYSCSWGPDDDGKTVDGPHYLASKAIRYGVDYGRGGYGAVYVVASGNGGRYGDNCNYDGYANSIYTITIGAVDETAVMPYYGEECASMLAVTFSSGNGWKRNIVTTDWNRGESNGCTDSHTGTSAAAPLAAGMIALMLQARPCLTWRDVQYILVLTAVKVDVNIAHWHKNKAGLHHSHQHGFGLMDAWRMVNTAKIWKSIPLMTSFRSDEQNDVTEIPAHSQSLNIDYILEEDDLSGYNLYTLEYVQVTITITHSHRGDLEIRLECPSHTDSILGAPRELDESEDGFQDWTFTTVRCWGEEPYGTWRLTVTDKGSSKKSRGQLVKWRLILYGSPMSFSDVLERRRIVDEAVSGKYLYDNISIPCSPPPVHNELTQPISNKWLKILALTGVFILFMAIYETFEYSFCYGEEKKEHAEKMAKEEADKESGAPGSEDAVPRQAADCGTDVSEHTRLLDNTDMISLEEYAVEITHRASSPLACQIDSDNTHAAYHRQLADINTDNEGASINLNSSNCSSQTVALLSELGAAGSSSDNCCCQCEVTVGVCQACSQSQCHQVADTDLLSQPHTGISSGTARELTHINSLDQ